jgi:AraC family transcriptional activator of pobA
MDEDVMITNESSLVPLVRDFVEAHYAEPISLRDVARTLGYSPAHLTNSFSRATGVPVNAWIVQRRIAAARKLLSEGSSTVASACEQVGFNDLCYFRRQFVRHVGVTPGRYRRGKALTPVRSRCA